MTTIVTEFQIPGGPKFSEENYGIGPSAELVDFKPERVRSSDVIGRRIDEIIPYAGTYGMGGPGFFGFKLGNDWLIIAIWGAGEWLQISGRRVQDMFYKLHGSPKPWMHDEIDEFSPQIIGRTITAIEIVKTAMTITLDTGITLDIAEDPDARPIFQGSKEPRVFMPEDDLRDAVFLSPTIELWI